MLPKEVNKLSGSQVAEQIIEPFSQKFPVVSETPLAPTYALAASHLPEE